MSIAQFLRILWAYRLLVIITTVATLVGALVAVLVVPPAYQAQTRVMLNTLKPDPVTGEVIPSTASKTFLATQIELIKDYGVAGQAVEALGWLSDPRAIEQYAADRSQDGDIRRALAQQIIDRTDVTVPSSTNILEIGFRSGSADDARAMANALRDAYIESTLNSRRREATRNADWYTQQAEKERVLLGKADEAKTAYEREAGIVMQDEKTDIETARLRALSSQSSLGAPIVSSAPITTSSAAAMQLAQLDSQIAQAGQNLGPNHPMMIELKGRRASLAKVVTDEQAAARAAAAVANAAAGQSAGALNRAVAQQTTRVIANREKIERLTQLQAEVNLHRGQMDKALSRAAELRQEAAVADSGITVLSEAVTPKKPTFPNKPLIFGGGLVLGAALGLLLSLLLEFLNRRVRGVEDLQSGMDAPLLAIISSAGLKEGKPSRWAPIVQGLPLAGRKMSRA